MKDFIKSLWTKSALPIVLFILVLSLGGGYLQYLAFQIQNQPIVVTVNDQTAHEAVYIEFDEIDTEIISSSSFPEVSSLLEQNKNEDALDILEKLISEKPELNEDVNFVRLYSRALIRLEQYEDASVLLTSASQNLRGNGSIFFNLGLVRNRMGDKTGAITAYKNALLEQPGYFEAGFNLGNLYLALKKNNLAVNALEKTVFRAGGAKRSRTLSSLGIAYRNSGNYVSGEEAFIESVNLDPSAIKPRLELAKLYSETGKIDKAENIYNEILLLDELNSQAYYGLAELSLLENDIPEAKRFLNEALHINPDYDDIRIKLAAILFEEQEFVNARSHLKWIVSNGNKVETALFQLGRIEYIQRDFIAASEYYTLALEYSENTNVEVLNNLGLSWKALGRVEDAGNIFLQAIEIDPFYYSAHYNLGLLYLEAEDYNNAEKSFNTVLGINPEFPEAWHNLAFVFSQKGLYRASIDTYEEALRIEPSNIKSRLNLAVQYKKLNELDKALEQYRLVLSLNPSYSNAWYNQALLYKAMDNYKESEKSYRMAIELNPEDVKYWQNLSVLLAGLNRADEAVIVLKDGIDVHPDSDDLRYNLALQYKKAGDRAAAQEELEKVISLNPQYVKAWLILGDIQSDNKNHRAAAQSYLNAVNLDPEDGYSKYQLGKELAHLGNYEEALGRFAEAAESIKDNAWIWYNLGKTQQKLGYSVEAEKSFKESLLIDPKMTRFIGDAPGAEEDSIEILNNMLTEDETDVDLRIKLAELLARSGDYEASLLEYANVFNIDPKNKNLWESKGETALDAEDLQTAEDAFKQLVDIDPLDGESHFSYGKLLYELGKAELAFNHLEQASKLMSSPVKALRFLGNGLYDEKNYIKSIEFLTEAVNLQPGDGTTLKDLGKAYYRNKEYENALTYFTRSMVQMPEYEWSYIWLARAMNKLSMYEDAVDTYNKAIAIMPEFIQSYIGLGDLESGRERFSEAAAYYRKALEIDPEHASTKRKLGRINS
ncbi:MAG: tetratricopeptide repeat protein [Spirochaetia bacterium]|jgi:tetratricopeptide (TPR) repeat protein|nr:tetratricopeptide repeat protein [Spirochaetia bacterium]